jgi:hypothetical protein
MSNRIVLGGMLLLTLGTAVAGTFLYGQEASYQAQPIATEAVAVEEPSEATIASWKATAVASNFLQPKLPI